MRKMKDSGIEWIDEIPECWNISRTKYVYQIASGNGFKDHLQGIGDGDYPFYKVSDINGSGMNVSHAANYISKEVVHEYRFNVVPAGALILAKIGEALKKNHRKITEVDCVVDNNLQALVPISNINDKYYYYQFLCIDMEWFDNGGTIPSVNNQKLLDFSLVMPPIAMQNRIASFLDGKCAEIDALIEAKEKTNALLKEQRQSIIYEAVTKGLNPNAPMKDSGIEWIGEIPESWNISRTKYVYQIASGNGFKDHLQGIGDGDYPFYKVSDINGSGMNVSHAANYISKEVVHEYRFNVVPAGALILAKIGEALKKNHRKITEVDCVVDNNLQALVPISNINDKYYYYQFLCIDMEWFDNGGTIPSVNNQKLLDFSLVTPPIAMQNRIASFLDGKCAEIDALIKRNNVTIEKLKEYRKSVIFEAVTGKKEI